MGIITRFYCFPFFPLSGYLRVPNIKNKREKKRKVVCTIVEQEKRRSQRIPRFSLSISQRNSGIRWGRYPFLLFYECTISPRDSIIRYCSLLVPFFCRICRVPKIKKRKKKDGGCNIQIIILFVY